MIHTGGCHCGNIHIAFESEVPPAAMEVRACQCSFCRKHASRAVSDPAGEATITVRDPDTLQRYRFGLRTADYFVCRSCGVYVAAVMADGEATYAVIVLNALDRAEAFVQQPLRAVFDRETEAQRRDRRRRMWTPTTVVGA